MREAKIALRTALRRKHPTGDCEAVCRRILSHPWFLRADCVMVYAATRGEPNLDALLRETLRQGKTLLLPRCQADGTMTACQIGDLNLLRAGRYGILEPPEHAKTVQPEEIDLILTPGMAFDHSGGRLGRGKGYYDRFLGRTKARLIGVCYDENLLDFVPMERFDQRVNAVVTDRRMILCEMEDDVCSEKRTG